jgi:hypothetical protein
MHGEIEGRSLYEDSPLSQPYSAFGRGAGGLSGNY